VYKATNYAKVEGVPEVVALKVIDKAKVEDQNDVDREIEIMGKVDHPNLIKLYNMYDEPKITTLVMELVTGGELFDRIVAKGNYTEKDAAGVIAQMCSALHYIHGMTIVHRDLKPENILYKTAESDEIKIADFGLARFIDSENMMKTACGTPGYVAPEILQNKGYDSGAVDMWSTGVIMYILLCGFPPFYEDELPALFDQIMKAKYDFPSPWWDEVSEGAKKLIGNLFLLDTKKRYTADQVLADPWTKEAPGHLLNEAQVALKKYNARRKLKKAMNTVVAQTKMMTLIKSLSAPPS
jgi:serine/threonine protein kinase